jgi:tetratricopeptide (TPR) repeat protein
MPRLDQLQKLHAADPNDAFLTYGIALEHAKAQQLDDAIAWLDKTLAIDPRYCYAFFQKAKALSEKGEEEQARATLRTGMEVAAAAGDAHAREEMAALLESMG